MMKSMKNLYNIYKMSILLLALAFAGVGRSSAAVAELENQYVKSADSKTAFTAGKWYVLSVNTGRKKVLAANGTALTTIDNGTNGAAMPSIGAKATDGNMPKMLFKAVSATGGFKLMNGDGKYIKLAVTSNSASASLVDNANNATVIKVAATNQSYVTLRSNSTLYYTYYGYLNNKGGASPNTSNESTTTAYQLYLYEVTFDTRYTVALNYEYDGNTIWSDTRIVDANGAFPDVKALYNDGCPATTRETYMIDEPHMPTLPSTVTANGTYAIPLTLRAKPYDPTIKGDDGRMFTSGTLDLLKNIHVYHQDANVTSLFTNPLKISFSIDDPKRGCTIDADGHTLHAGSEAGTITIKAHTLEIGSSSDPEHWYSQSDDCSFVITITKVDAYINAFETAYKALVGYTDIIGSRLGKYSLYYTEGGVIYDNNTYLSAVASYASIMNSITTTSKGTVTAATESINKLLELIRDKESTGVYKNIQLNLPTPGTLIRITDTAVSGYYTPNGTAGGTGMNKQNTPSAANIFYYYDPSAAPATPDAVVAPSADQSVLLSYANGTYMHATADAGMTTLAADPQVFTFSAADATTTNGLYAATGCGTHTYTLEEVTTLPLVVTDKLWATLYCPVALTIPGNVKAYVESAAPVDGRMPVTPIMGTVPAGTALIINAPAGTYDFAVTTTGKHDVVPNLYLTGTFPYIATSSVAPTVFTLQPKSTGVGFYQWNASTDYSTHLLHFKAYYDANSGSSAQREGFLLEFLDATGLDAVTLDPSDAPEASSAIYNLQGQRVSADPASLPRGLYIRGGRKVLLPR